MSLDETFRIEALELLEELEAGLLELEEHPDEAGSVAKVFRDLHTIKGAAGMVGFERLEAFVHELETAFELVRTGKLAVSSELTSLTLSACDLIKAMAQGLEPETGETETLVVSLHRLLNMTTLAGNEELTYRVGFRPYPDLFRRGLHPAGMFQELARLGDLQMLSAPEVVPEPEQLESVCPELCWEAELITAADENAIRDIFIFVEDDGELDISIVNGADAEAGLSSLNGSGASSPKSTAQTSAQQTGPQLAASIRVQSEKLDSLVDLVGEMVTVQSRLSRIVQENSSSELLSIAEEVEQLTWEMRDQILNIRMLPIGSTFSRFRRLVRDLSRELGKDVSLVTSGAETALDKTVIERLYDPLVHLVRNAIGHGIEAPEVRRTANKAEHGKVFLSATNSGPNVVIEVRDDGRGLDRSAIRQRAVAAGLWSDDAEINDRDLLRLICAPGFSTVDEVTSLSGRGVGMDAVRQAIEGLSGALDLQTSPGEGTTFTIRLPLTLAIIEGLLVSIGDTCYVFPMAMVEECVELRADKSGQEQRRTLANVRGEAVPYVRLRQYFAAAGAPPTIEKIVIAEVEGERIGFVVDEVIGEHQTVIKNLGRLYRDVQGISGATIMGDGRVALILDLPALSSGAENQERQCANQ